MFIGTRKNNGIPYLYLLRSYRVIGSSSPRVEIKFKFGPVSKVHSRVQRMIVENDKKARSRLSKILSLDFEQGDTDAMIRKVMTGEWDEDGLIHEEERKKLYSNFNKIMPLHYGHLVFKDIWEKEFELKYKLDYIQRKYTDIKTWQLNDLIFYLSFLKILDPGSYLNAYENKANYLYCPWSDIGLDAFYRALDILDTHKERLIEHSVKRYLENAKSSVKVAFFDCTNTWFETPYDDVTWSVIKYTHKVTEAMRATGKTNEQIDKYLLSEEFETKLKEHFQLNEKEVLRMRGPSKEGRYAQPLITVALVINQDGFPIDMKVFAGNLSEMKTVVPVLDSLKEKYNVKDTYFVADRGLNSTHNLDTIKSHGLGYIVAQKVSGMKKNIRDEILSLENYKNCIFSNGEWVSVDSSFNEQKFRYKVCDFVKTTFIHDENGEELKNGKRKRRKINVECKILYTFSPERRNHDLNELDNQIKKANQAVAEGYLMGNPNGSGWRSLVMTEKEVQASNGQKNLEQYRAVGLKKEIIQSRREIAGYAAYVFSHPSEAAALEISDLQVLTIYNQLVRIEDCFRIMKSKFSIRPVYLYTNNRIKAHCLICFFALMLLRSLQIKLEQNDISLSYDKIIKALNSSFVIPMRDGKREITMLNACIDQSLYKTKWTGKGRIEKDINELDDAQSVWNAYAKERETVPDDIDTLLNIVNLKPLERQASLGEVKRCLGVQNYKECDMLPKVLLLEMEATK